MVTDSHEESIPTCNEKLSWPWFIHQFVSLDFKREQKGSKWLYHRDKVLFALFWVEHDWNSKQKLLKDVDDVINFVFIFENTNECLEHLNVYVRECEWITKLDDILTCR